MTNKYLSSRNTWFTLQLIMILHTSQLLLYLYPEQIRPLRERFKFFLIGYNRHQKWSIHKKNISGHNVKHDITNGNWKLSNLVFINRFYFSNCSLHMYSHWRRNMKINSCNSYVLRLISHWLPQTLLRQKQEENVLISTVGKIRNKA